MRGLRHSLYVYVNVSCTAQKCRTLQYSGDLSDFCDNFLGCIAQIIGGNNWQA